MTTDHISVPRELLPCPFCGTTDLLGFEPSHEGGWTVVKCRKCGCSGSTGLSTSESEAVAFWNRRALLAAQPVGQSLAASDVLAERKRQVEVEGWTPEHDDEHTLGDLGLAAALYALPYDAVIGGERLLDQDDYIGLDIALELTCGWRPKPEPDARKRMVKAGALILAEIERLDRAAPTKEKGN